MPRPDVDSTIRTQLAGQTVERAAFVQVEFDSGTTRVWTGTRNITVLGGEFLGAGELLAISEHRMRDRPGSESMTFTLSGLSPLNMNQAMQEPVHNRRTICWTGFMNRATGGLTGAVRIFDGFADTSRISHDDDNTVSWQITAENVLIRQRYATGRRQTYQAHLDEWPGDVFYSHVHLLGDQPFVWPAEGWQPHKERNS